MFDVTLTFSGKTNSLGYYGLIFIAAHITRTHDSHHNPGIVQTFFIKFISASNVEKSYSKIIEVSDGGS